MDPRVGAADDADRDHQYAQRRRRARRARGRLRAPPRPAGASWSLPVVGETWDGLSTTSTGTTSGRSTCTPRSTRRAAARSPKANVGGGTGMICHGFKGGIGTASRVIAARSAATRSACSCRRTTAGATAAGRRRPGRRGDRRRRGPEPVRPPGRAPVPSIRRGSGSIIVVVATDAPLLPHQCERLAQRAGSASRAPAGPAGTRAATCSSPSRRATGCRSTTRTTAQPPLRLPPVGDGVIDALFDGVIEATEEAIVNALVAADDDDRPRRHHRPRPPP